MKKTFKLTSDSKKPERVLDAIRNEVKKYLKRERKKTLPEKADFWDFDCKIGKTSEKASPFDITNFNAELEKVAKPESESFYLEILAKPGYKGPKKA